MWPGLKLFEGSPIFCVNSVELTRRTTGSLINGNTEKSWKETGRCICGHEDQEEAGGTGQEKGYDRVRLAAPADRQIGQVDPKTHSIPARGVEEANMPPLFYSQSAFKDVDKVIDKLLIKWFYPPRKEGCSCFKRIRGGFKKVFPEKGKLLIPEIGLLTTVGGFVGAAKICYILCHKIFQHTTYSQKTREVLKKMLTLFTSCEKRLVRRVCVPNTICC